MCRYNLPCNIQQSVISNPIPSMYKPIRYSIFGAEIYVIAPHRVFLATDIPTRSPGSSIGQSVRLLRCNSISSKPQGWGFETPLGRLLFWLLNFLCWLFTFHLFFLVYSLEVHILLTRGDYPLWNGKKEIFSNIKKKPGDFSRRSCMRKADTTSIAFCQ